MSLTPYIPTDAFDDWSLWPQYTNPWFGYPYPYLPWFREVGVQGQDDLEMNRDGFKVNVDVQHFKPEEILVKVKDNVVTVEGKHEERRDEHGYVMRQFQRHYYLPDEVDPAAVQSKLSSDGVLTIEGPKKPHSGSSNERIVPVSQTRTPAVGFFHGMMDKFKHFLSPGRHSVASSAPAGSSQ